MEHLICPDCGQRVALNAKNIIATHDEVPPCRMVCRASGADATRFVAALATARAEAALAERDACIAALQAMVDQFDAERAKCQQGSQLWFDRLAQTTALMIARTAIAARSNGRARDAAFGGAEEREHSGADVPPDSEAVLAGPVAEAREAIAVAAERRAEQLRTEELERGAFARAATFERAAELVAFAAVIRAESKPREPSRQAGAR